MKLVVKSADALVEVGPFDGRIVIYAGGPGEGEPAVITVAEAQSIISDLQQHIERITGEAKGQPVDWRDSLRLVADDTQAWIRSRLEHGIMDLVTDEARTRWAKRDRGLVEAARAVVDDGLARWVVFPPHGVHVVLESEPHPAVFPDGSTVYRVGRADAGLILEAMAERDRRDRQAHDHSDHKQPSKPQKRDHNGPGGAVTP